jgi:hypothetical protein
MVDALVEPDRHKVGRIENAGSSVRWSARWADQLSEDS